MKNEEISEVLEKHNFNRVIIIEALEHCTDIENSEEIKVALKKLLLKSE